MVENATVSEAGPRVSKKVGPRKERCHGIKGILTDTGGENKEEPNVFLSANQRLTCQLER